MQTTKTTAAAIEITIAAGTVIGGGPFNAGMALRQPITVQAELHSAKGTPRTGDDWYSFEYGGWDCMVLADRVRVVTPDPTPEPPTTTTAHKRPSREAQRNAATQQVWQSLRHEGDVVGSDGTQEYWTCASQSQPGTRYTITRDLVSGYMHCDCTSGQYGRDCKHQAAARRYVASRAENIRRAADAAVQARQADADRQRDTAPRRQQSFSFWR